MWPTAAEIGIAARVELEAGGTGFWTVDYHYDVTELLERVVADLAAECGRPLGFEEQTVTETFDGGKRVLHVKHPPIVEVTTVTNNDDDDVLDPDDEEYHVYERYVKLPREVQTARVAVREATPQLWTVVYVGGYDDDGIPLPSVLKSVCAEIATRMLLRIDQQYRVYGNVNQFQDGEIRSVFGDKEKAFADQYARLRQAGLVLSVTR
jgi:hypothetical protein